MGKETLSSERAAQLGTYRAAMLQVLSKSPRATDRQRNILASASTVAKRPRLWDSMEHWTANYYHRKTGTKLPVAGFDWSQLITWLTENLPAILKAVMAIIALFA